jgi:hypothetical protein
MFAFGGKADISACLKPASKRRSVAFWRLRMPKVCRIKIMVIVAASLATAVPSIAFAGKSGGGGNIQTHDTAITKKADSNSSGNASAAKKTKGTGTGKAFNPFSITKKADY